MHKKLLDLYECLYETYGLQNWWSSQTAFDVIIEAILVQSTAMKNVDKAISNLKAADLLTPDRLAEVPQEQLETLIRPSGYYRVKTKKIRAFMEHLQKYHNRLDLLFATELPQLRKELLSIFGLGDETADTILLYAAKKPTFVVDQYTYRLLTRLGWFEGKYHYGRLQKIFMESLPHDVRLFSEYHALIVRHGKERCRKTKPQCETCVLQMQCPYSRN